MTSDARHTPQAVFACLGSQIPTPTVNDQQIIDAFERLMLGRPETPTAASPSPTSAPRPESLARPTTVQQRPRPSSKP